MKYLCWNLSRNSVTHEVFFTIIHKIEKLLQAHWLLVDLLVINQSFDVDYTHMFVKYIEKLFANMLIKCMTHMVRHIYATLVVQPLSIQATGSPFHFCRT